MEDRRRVKRRVKVRITKAILINAIEESNGSKASVIAELSKVIGGKKIAYKTLNELLTKHVEAMEALEERRLGEKEDNMDMLITTLKDMCKRQRYVEAVVKETKQPIGTNPDGTTMWHTVERTETQNHKVVMPNLSAAKTLLQGYQNGDYNQHINVEMKGVSLTVDELTKEELADMFDEHTKSLRKSLEKESKRKGNEK